MMGCRLGPDAGGIDHSLLPQDDMVVDAVFDKRARVDAPKQSGVVRFVLGEQQPSRALNVEVIVRKRLLKQGVGVMRVDDAVSITWQSLQAGARTAAHP